MAIGYRHTKTYIAASFDHDRDAVEKLYEWNKDKVTMYFPNKDFTIVPYGWYHYFR